MAKSTAVTINAVRLEQERRKTLSQQEAWALTKMFFASPLFQIVGTVAVTEILEKQEILSDRWAGAIEGGVITMVGLQALKDFGVIGAAAVGTGIAVGSGLPGDWGSIDFTEPGALAKRVLSLFGVNLGVNL